MDANILIQQLGGNKFFAMTGVRKEYIVVGKKDLQMDIPAKSTNGRINKIWIELASNDTYTLKAYRFNRRTLECPQVGETISNVYAENLKAAFTTLTGLFLNL
jgi:hypothetical protein